MATFTHTITNDPPRAGAGMPTVTAVVAVGPLGGGGKAGEPLVTITCDDGTNQYVITGFRDRVLEYLQELRSVIHGLSHPS